MGTYKSNSKELKAQLDRLKVLAAGGAFSDALVAGLNAGAALMKQRIFNQGQDANGNPLGPYYDEPWKRHRQREGRQVGYKDLEFTGSLRRSIEVVSVNNTRAEVRFTDDDSANIGRWQEQQVYNMNHDLPARANSGKVPIFQFNEREVAVAQATTSALIQQRLKLTA